MPRPVATVTFGPQAHRRRCGLWPWWPGGTGPPSGTQERRQRSVVRVVYEPAALKHAGAAGRG